MERFCYICITNKDGSIARIREDVTEENNDIGLQEKYTDARLPLW